MDTGKGNFEMFESLEEAQERAKGLVGHGGIFTLGEEVELKGSLFRVKSIKPSELRLKLLRRDAQKNLDKG